MYIQTHIISEEVFVFNSSGSSSVNKIIISLRVYTPSRGTSQETIVSVMHVELFTLRLEQTLHG